MAPCRTTPLRVANLGILQGPRIATARLPPHPTRRESTFPRLSGEVEEYVLEGFVVAGHFHFLFFFLKERKEGKERGGKLRRRGKKREVVRLGGREREGSLLIETDYLAVGDAGFVPRR